MGELDVFPSVDWSRLTAGYQIGHVLERRLGPPVHVHNFAFTGAIGEDDLSGQLLLLRNNSHDPSLEGENTGLRVASNAI